MPQALSWAWRCMRVTASRKPSARTGDPSPELWMAAALKLLDVPRRPLSIVGRTYRARVLHAEHGGNSGDHAGRCLRESRAGADRRRGANRPAIVLFPRLHP